MMNVLGTRVTIGRHGLAMRLGLINNLVPSSVAIMISVRRMSMRGWNAMGSRLDRVQTRWVSPAVKVCRVIRFQRLGQKSFFCHTPRHDGHGCTRHNTMSTIVALPQHTLGQG